MQRVYVGAATHTQQATAHSTSATQNLVLGMGKVSMTWLTTLDH
jgi:hypothetical protein